MTVVVLAVAPFIIFVAVVLAIGYLRAPRTDEPLPSVAAMAMRLVWIQGLGLAAAFLTNAVVGGAGMIVYLAAQAGAAVVLVGYGLNAALARR